MSSRQIPLDPASAEQAALTEHTATMSPGGQVTPRSVIGETLGHYQVIDEIGRGGMGTVYRAYDLRLSRQVALKMVTSTAASRRERLQREAQALAQLAHPNVVPVYDVGVVDDAVYMAMELIEGQSLRQWFTAQPRSVAEVLRVFAAAGDGLAAAHAAGLVHRDFKPGNVLVGTDGRIRVVDFGLARAVGSGELDTPLPTGATSSDEPDSGEVDLTTSGVQSTRRSVLESPLTQAGDVVGTPRYMSPEQRKGGFTDARTDQFSFCVALYEALFGEHPFGNKTARRRHEEGIGPVPPPRRAVPGHVRRAVLRGLERDPERRFPSMSLLVAELRRDVPARRRRIAIGLAGALTVPAAIAIAALTQGGEDTQCAGAGERADAAWRSGLRGAVERAVLATGRPYAPQIAARLQGQVDDYVTRWADLRTQTCRATRIHGEQSELVMDCKITCLDDGLEQVTAFARALVESPTDTAMNRALGELEKVSSLAVCKDADALARRDQIPVRADEAAAVASTRDGIRQVRALVAVGNAAEVEPIARKIYDASRRLHHVPTRAQAVAAYAEASKLRGQVAETRRALDEALRLAAEAGDRTLLAMTWSRLLWQIAVVERHVSAGVELIRATDVAMLMAREEPDYTQVELEVGHTLGAVQLLAGDLAGAETRYRQMLELTQGADQSFRHATTLNNLSIILTYRGKVDEARTLLDRARKSYQAVVGGTHPMLSDVELNTGLTYHWQGDLGRAETAYRHALELANGVLGTSHPRAWLFHLYLGTVLVDRGAWDAAAPQLEAALAGFSGALGGDGELARHVRVQRARLHLGKGDLAAARADIDEVRASLVRTQSVDQPTPGYLHPLLIEGQIALAEGAPDAAEAALRGALDRLQRLYGAGSLELAPPHIALAEVALVRGRPRDAIVAATAALAILRGGGSVEHDPRRAQALFAHARALRAIDPSSREAEALAADAATIWESVAAGHPQAAAARALLGRATTSLGRRQ